MAGGRGRGGEGQSGAGWWESDLRGRVCGRRRHLIGCLPLLVSLAPDWLVGGGVAWWEGEGLGGPIRCQLVGKWLQGRGGQDKWWERGRRRHLVGQWGLGVGSGEGQWGPWKV